MGWTYWGYKGDLKKEDCGGEQPEWTRLDRCRWLFQKGQTLQISFIRMAVYSFGHVREFTLEWPKSLNRALQHIQSSISWRGNAQLNNHGHREARLAWSFCHADVPN